LIQSKLKFDYEFVPSATNDQNQLIIMKIY
jgi:hypothetical protein